MENNAVHRNLAVGSRHQIQEPDDSIGIMLLDNNTLFRESLSQALDYEAGLTVVGETSSIKNAIRMAEELRPSVVLLDGDTSGEIVERMRLILRASPTSRILVLTTHDDPWLIGSILTHGARGYLLKDVTRQELISAIKSIWKHRSYMVMIANLQALSLNGSIGRMVATVISKRERDILVLVADGLSNAQIGKRLSIREGTVKRHLGNAFIKLGAVSRMDAVNKAIMASLIPAASGVRRAYGRAIDAAPNHQAS